MTIAVLAALATGWPGARVAWAIAVIACSLGVLLGVVLLTSPILLIVDLARSVRHLVPLRSESSEVAQCAGPCSSPRL